MADLVAQVLADRAQRDSARAEFDAHYAALKADFEERGIAGRLADEAIDQARAIFDEAVTVAQAHPGAIGGTFVALALWILRTPLLAWAEQALGSIASLKKELEGD